MRPADGRDTIAAIATAAGEAGIAIVRLSGPGALAVADAVFRTASGIPPSAQKNFTSQFGHVVERTPRGEERIDEGLVFVMRAPRSFTREDTAEFSCHGGRLIVQKVLERCLRNGARAAEPGEFTKRAFLNGRIDLVQAEAVLDLIRAKSDAARRIAQAQLEGRVSRRIAGLRDALALLLSHIEAAIDFPDERLGAPPDAEIRRRLEEIRAELGRLLDSARPGVLAKEGVRTVLVGRPNVGKSSLMNALAREDRVIVSPHPGTTRDAVELELRLGPSLVRVVDTAGLREGASPVKSGEPIYGASGAPHSGENAADTVEAEGMRRTRHEIRTGDLVLFVVDGSAPPAREDVSLWSGLGEKPRFLIVNKDDLCPPGRERQYDGLNPGGVTLRTSCVSLAGIDELARRIGEFARGPALEAPDEAWISSVRHRALLERADAHIRDAMGAFERHLSSEFPASDVRLAIEAFGEIVGEVVTDDILDLIFSQFCIGK